MDWRTDFEHLEDNTTVLITHVRTMKYGDKEIPIKCISLAHRSKSGWICNHKAVEGKGTAFVEVEAYDDMQGV